MKAISRAGKIIFASLIFFIAIFIGNENVFAATKDVSTFTQLEDAVTSAQKGDIINVKDNITVTKTLEVKEDITIKSDDKKTLTAGQLKMDSVKECNMFYVSGDKELKLDNITLDGANKARIIYSDGGILKITNSTIKNGSPGANAKANPGGGIFLRGGSLTATNTNFIGNTPGTNPDLPAGDKDLNGGAIYSGSTTADITITGGKFEDNEVKAYGHGAAIYQENGILNVTGTSFKNNKGHVEGGNAGTQGACIHTRDKVKATISNVNAEIAKGFNTGGFLRSWGSNVTVTGSTFTIKDLGDGYGYSGGALCFENSTSKVTGSTFTCTGSKLFHAGGFIDIVGGGTHTIDGNTMTGSGNDNNSAIASFGGAISVEQGAEATVTIRGNTITNSTASDNGGAIAIGTYVEAKIPKTKPEEAPIPKDTPSTVTMNGNKISDSGLIMWKGGAGGAVFVGKEATVAVSGDEIKDTKAPYGGGIYNEGNIYISGGASLTGGAALTLGGEIYNNGTLVIDDATISGWFVGDGWWQNRYPGKPNEYGGTNIYAEKDVIITQKAKITKDKDIRVIDGKSAMLLTENLKSEIDISISEVALKGEDAFENKYRKVGYVVAKGVTEEDFKELKNLDQLLGQIKELKENEENKALFEKIITEFKDVKKSYTADSKDAEQTHYLSKAYDKTKPASDDNQPIAEFTDHTNPGKWDFVLNPENKQVVLGQRVKLIYHGNKGKIVESDSESKPVTVYKKTDFWKEQLENFKVADPTRKDTTVDPAREYSFMGWYHWIDDANETAENNTDSIQELKDPSSISKKLFDFSRVEFSNNNKDEIVNILTPNVINTYAGWSENIDLEVEKKWQKSDGTEITDGKEKQNITITLFDGENQVG